MIAANEGVLAVIDGCARVAAQTNPRRAAEVREARAAVAECFAERDRLRNIVRSHEAQILRMTAERAELVEAGKQAKEVLGNRWFSGDRNNDDVIAADERLTAALARCGGES